MEKMQIETLTGVIDKKMNRQLKQYIDDAAQAKNEVSELKRELFKLQNRK